jgi:hypothetical protein
MYSATDIINYRQQFCLLGRCVIASHDHDSNLF